MIEILEIIMKKINATFTLIGLLTTASSSLGLADNSVNKINSDNKPYVTEGIPLPEPVPAISSWGYVALIGLTLTAGSVVFRDYQKNKQ